MKLNICYRLIEKMTKEGFNFVNVDYYNLSNIPPIILHKFIPMSLYANRDYKFGELIRTLDGELRLYPLKGSIKIDKDMYLTDEFGKFIQHSINPNTKLHKNKLIAIKNICKNEEITCNLDL